MKNYRDLFFTNKNKILKRDYKDIENISIESENIHIFFCQGLILTKIINNKIKIKFFNKRNVLFQYIDKTVYLGKYKGKVICVHNLFYNRKNKAKLNQIDFFNNILKENRLINLIFSDLRKIFVSLSLVDSSIASISKSLINWKLENIFCTKCGEKFKSVSNYHWENRCDSCDRIYFPRIDPVIIVVIVNENKTLIGRSHHFPDKLYSCLAGFVELGETLKIAAKREIKEEVGLDIYDIKFITDQPWPFPSSLMFGLLAKTKTKKLKIDKNEIEDAFWVSKEDLKQVLNGKNSDFLPARKGTIARYLLEKWVNDKI